MSVSENATDELQRLRDELAAERQKTAELQTRVQREHELSIKHEELESRYQQRLEELKREKERMANMIEKEEEFLVNKMAKQLDTLKTERRALHDEKVQLKRHVADLTSQVARLCRDKVQLECQLEIEEESITNRLQRQLDAMMMQYRRMEQRLESCGIKYDPASDVSEDEGGMASMRARAASSMSASPMSTYLLGGGHPLHGGAAGITGSPGGPFLAGGVRMSPSLRISAGAPGLGGPGGAARSLPLSAAGLGGSFGPPGVGGVPPPLPFHPRDPRRSTDSDTSATSTPRHGRNPSAEQNAAAMAQHFATKRLAGGSAAGAAAAGAAAATHPAGTSPSPPPIATAATLPGGAIGGLGNDPMEVSGVISQGGRRAGRSSSRGGNDLNGNASVDASDASATSSHSAMMSDRTDSRTDTDASGKPRGGA